MAIAKNPKRNSTATSEQSAEAFISGAGKPPANQEDTARKLTQAITIRVDPDILARMDRAAKRLGITRTAFIVSSAAERLERME